MTFVFDIDGTICTTTDGDYDYAEPIRERIELINNLYDEGHTIVFQTARGMGRTNNNQLAAYVMFYNYTAEQLESWEVKYHALYLGKPSGDIYVDDKAMRDVDFFEQMEKSLQ
jgi:capsule biosynthesis phosphatase